MSNDIHSSDFLVIGTGLAGLLFAIKAAEHGKVTVLTKRTIMETATSMAQGGIAAVITDEDCFEKHIEDTMRVGDGLCHRSVVEEFVTAGPKIIGELVQMGVDFCKVEKGDEYELGLEGGHCERRVLHVKDHTGLDIQKAVVSTAKATSNITILEHHMAVNLVIHQDRVRGSYVLDVKSGEVKRFVAKATILATGGAGKVFLYTSNPEHATGDGIAMAYRVGATITNMEFCQFHPTLLYHHKIRSFLISEALRGEGAVLLGPDGKRFMDKYHEDAELAPRDVVARAIDNEMKRTGADHVWLDISFKNPEFVKDRFPAIYEECMKGGIDITKEPIPVVPAMHYVCGGIKTDTHGRTDVKGLYAVGETAGTGFHGANRMASNSLLEAAVLGHNAAEAVKETLEWDLDASLIAPWDPGEATDPDELVIITHMWDEIRRLMANYVGIVRSHKRLIRARNRIGFIQKEINQFYWDFMITPDLIELRNIAIVAELIIKMARMRKESRGAHYNIDYPEKSSQKVDTILKKSLVPID